MAKALKIQPDARNANRGTARGLALLRQSLQESGAGRSVLVDKHGRLIAGNKTFQAWEQLVPDAAIEVVHTDGQTLVVVQRDDLDLDDPKGLARKLAYYDNRSSELDLAWNVEQVLADIQAGVDLTGLWNKDELDSLLAGLNQDTNATSNAVVEVEPEIDRAEELRQQYGVEVGQLWALGRHRVLCGDCADGTSGQILTQHASVTALVSDPPYGMSWNGAVSRGKHSHGSKGAKSSFYGRKILNDDKPFNPLPFLHFQNVIFWGFHHFSDRLPLGSVLVWIKRLDAAFGSFLSDADLAWMKGGEGVYCFRDQSLMSETHERMHPTQKPVPLMAWCIAKVSSEGDVIYDPFLGSGTTLIACEQLNRQCYGIEIDPRYVAVALHRWATLTGQSPQLLALGTL